MAKVLERSLYQTDYYAWTKDQAAKLRAMAARRENSTLDLENLDRIIGTQRLARRTQPSAMRD